MDNLKSYLDNINSEANSSILVESSEQMRGKTFTTELTNELQPLVTPEELLEINKIKDLQSKETEFDKLRKKGWIQTFTGKKFFPLESSLDSLDIEDIAHALSMICRFTGHVKEFYSVAQHCVLVSYLCDYADRKHGLLHDGSEAYLMDIAAPIKRLPEFNFYKTVEYTLQSNIYKKFNLDIIEPSSVKRADLLMLSTEATALLPNLHEDWVLPFNPAPIKFEPLLPKDAKKLFLTRFRELFNEK